jgi:hypothetical protein
MREYFTLIWGILREKEGIMEININKRNKIAELWLSNAEKRNPLLQNALKPFIEHYNKQKYTVALFLSGEADLTENTAELLKVNKMR